MSSTQTQLTRPLPWTTADILAATGGELLCGDMQKLFAGVSIDSRNIAAEDIFVAIRGQVHDGHAFIPGVITGGVKGIILDHENSRKFPVGVWQKKGVVLVAVKETTRALGDLAAFNRKRADVSVIAITGSNGKTTTKEMTAAVVSRHFRTLSTSGNLNNEIGLPLTLMRLSPQHQWAVLELGMNNPGEIGRLAEICQPDLGVITNISRAHLEGLGSINGVMKAKGELLEKLKKEGTAVLNADDAKVMELARSTTQNKILFGISPGATVRAVAVRTDGVRTKFRLVLPADELDVTLPVCGHFMVYNALAAAAAGIKLGFSATEIKSSLEGFKPVNGRMHIIHTKKKIHIVDDTYNANPASMRAAISALSDLKGKGRGMLVAADMLELGDQAETLHRQIGAFAARSHIDRIYFTGEFAGAVTDAAREQGMSAQALFTGTREEIFTKLTQSLKSNDWVLVKGSRAMGMEKIVRDLKAWAGQAVQSGETGAADE